ncbi:MAG: tetratricopeptide repeat protein [Elusimicrobiota bacterium]|nr:tetratricopeptide repeat protein [Elusimicrobiota bacterium]
MNNNKSEKLEDLLEKAKFYFLNNKYRDAIKEYKKALKIEEENTEVLYNLGVAYESANQAELARETYNLTLKIDPGHKLAKEHIDKMIEK